jgi:hypothetical protein
MVPPSRSLVSFAISSNSPAAFDSDSSGFGMAHLDVLPGRQGRKEDDG